MVINRSGLLWPSLLAVAGLAVLIGLGLWQLQRLAWKEDLIARIDSRAQAAPVDLDAALARWRRSGDVEYLRVRLHGRFRHGEEAHVYALSQGEAGWRVIAPFETDDGWLVMVDRGFVPGRLKEPSQRRAGQVEGPATVVGLARAPESQAPFVPDNDPAANVWYWRDLPAMAGRAMSTTAASKPAPFLIEADATPNPGGWPKGGATRLTLPNRHLEYALTWFGLAAALAAVYGAFVAGRRKGASTARNRR